jgi:DNA mismatch endonuclease (patch repair protein)
LRRALSAEALRFEVNTTGLPGKPDIVFPNPRVAIFCDGDFWHGRHLRSRIVRLNAGHNAQYWSQKIRRNAARDRMNSALLRADGWRVVRLWETDILRQTEKAVAMVRAALSTQSSPRRRSSSKTPPLSKHRDR